MRFIFILFLLSKAWASGGNPTDGNQIAEPILSDYAHAERTPGFSPVTDVVDQHGNQLSQ